MKTPFDFRRVRDGSVLLVTLLSLALLLLVTLAFVATVRMELRKVLEHQDSQQARTNARLGAELAVARLQELAGPDTRVTYTPESTSDTPPHANNRFWTGVRDSAPFRSGPNPSSLTWNSDYAQSLGWLISGNPSPEGSLFSAPMQPVASAELLVGPGSVRDPDQAVAAPAVSLASSQGIALGTYAFWAGQENTKAQINLTDPFRDSPRAEEQAFRAMTVQRNATEALLSGFNPDNPRHQMEVGRILTPSQLDLLELDEPLDFRDTFHDITVQSYGLPANSRRGGLKRDLSAVLDEAEANSGQPGGTQYQNLLDFQRDRIARLFQESEALPGANPGVPPHVWNAANAMQMRLEQASPDNQTLIHPPFTDMSLRYDTGGPAWSQLITWSTTGQRRLDAQGRLQTARNRPDIRNPHPVIAKFNLSVYYTVDWPRIRLHFIPAVVLWNPYDVPLAPREYWMVYEYGIQHMEGFKLNFLVRNPQWRGGQAIWTPQYTMRFQTNAWTTQHRFRLAPAEIPAGAAVIFTMNEHMPMAIVGGERGNTEWSERPRIHTDSTPNVIDKGYVSGSHVIDLYPGWHGGGGFSHYVEERDISEKVRMYARQRRNTYSGHWNWWDRAGLPFYPNTDNAVDWTGNPVPEEDMEIALNINGLSRDQGWEVVESVVSLKKTGVGGTQLLTPTLVLNHSNSFNAGDWNTSRDYDWNLNRQPWHLLRHVNGSLPGNLHEAEASDGLFPGVAGLPPSFPGNSTPFAFQSPDTPSFPLWGFTWGLRLPNNSFVVNSAGGGSNIGAPIHWLAHYNPSASYQTRSGFAHSHYGGSTREYNNLPNHIGGFSLDGELFDLGNTSDDDYHALIGHSDRDPPGDFRPGMIPRSVVYEVPRSLDELVSIASFAHAGLQSYGGPTTRDSGGFFHGSRLAHRQIQGNASQQPAHPIGNSLLHPLAYPHMAQRSYFPTALGPENPPISIPYNQGEWGHHAPTVNNQRPYVAFRGFYDTSWVLNDVLWDDFMLTPRSNSRLRWQPPYNDPAYHDPQENSPLLGTHRDINASAARLRVEGAFNVNSTSVDAWRALLFSLLDIEIANRDGQSDLVGSQRVPFARFLHPHGRDYSPHAPANDLFDDQTNYTGNRRLTLEEVDDLAEAIVQQVRERGPFLSLADFVNRRLLTPDQDGGRGHYLQGALQAAIEAAGLNTSQTLAGANGSHATPTQFQATWQGLNHFFGMSLEAVTQPPGPGLHGGPTNRSASGYLMQADLLARIGSVLQVRSDTFVIRAAGTTPSGARAWCEIRVQRIGDYIDTGNGPGDLPEDLNPVNRTFGRRFEVISFRWLNEEEV